MFEAALFESTHSLRSSSRWSTVASIAVQAAIAAVLLSIPLLRPERLPLLLPVSARVPLPHLAPPPPPPVRVPLAPDTASALSAPSAPTAPQPTSSTPSQPTFPTTDAPPTAGTSISMLTSGPAVPATFSSGPAAPAIAVRPAVPAGLLNISRGVSAGLLLAPIRPSYPPIARVAHIEGTVIVHAIISASGNIESASVVSGPVMLQSSALEAVRSAHYKPYRLNGQPTEVETTFSINFHMNE